MGSGRAKAMMAHVTDLSATKHSAKVAPCHTYIDLAESPISVGVKQPNVHEAIQCQPSMRACSPVNCQPSMRACSPVNCLPTSPTESYNFAGDCEYGDVMSHTKSLLAPVHQPARTGGKDETSKDDTSESSRLSHVGMWSVHPWAHMTFRDQPPDVDYSTCDKLSSADEWQAADTMHFTTLEWLMSEAHPGIHDVMHTSTHTPFEAAGWTASEGRTCSVWSKPVVCALQKLWSDERWRNAMQSCITFNDFAWDILNDRCYILKELYHCVYIQGSVPWSNWWYLSANTPFRVHGAAGIVMQEATTHVRLHPLIGSHGGIFNSGHDGSVVQVPDNVGRPYRIIPTDYDMIGLCMATQPKGTHFVTAGIINIRDASKSALECSLYTGMYNMNMQQHPSFQVLIMDSLHETSPAGLLNSLLQTCGLVGANGNFTSQDHITGTYCFTPSSVSMREMRDVYTTHLQTPKQINMNTCALHAACNLQRLICICRAQTDSMKVGKDVKWYPHPESWITQCVGPRDRSTKAQIVGSYPVEVMCTIFWLRSVIKQKLEILPSGTSSVLYRKICDSMKRMLKGAPVHLDSLVYKDIPARVKVYKSSFSTHFDNARDKLYDETTKYAM